MTNTVTSLQDIHQLLPDEAAPDTRFVYDNSYKVVSLMMYLTGVEERHFAEHKNFYDRYLKTMRLKQESDGRVHLLID